MKNKTTKTVKSLHKLKEEGYLLLYSPPFSSISIIVSPDESEMFIHHKSLSGEIQEMVKVISEVEIVEYFYKRQSTWNSLVGKEKGNENNSVEQKQTHLERCINFLYENGWFDHISGYIC